MRSTILAFGLLALLAGCDRTNTAADQADNGTARADTASNRVAAAADRLADATDAWGDNASDRISNAGARVGGHIADANDRLARIVDPAADVARTDRWVGRWRGVEGLMLTVEKDRTKGPGHYILTDQYTLDDKGVFDGVADGDGIRFDRPDGHHTLAATDGAATGLSHLAGKRDCLTVKAGEGYCRD
jgi:hypothetical protein